jgi:Protein of unknown function (DUF551)
MNKAQQLADERYPILWDEDKLTFHNRARKEKRAAFIAGYEADKWIRVEDEPVENGIYMIWYFGLCEAHFKDGKWIDTQATEKSTSPYLQSRFRRQVNPTHWQPLPQPPKTN